MIVSLGSTKNVATARQQLDVISNSPRHRGSIVPSTGNSMSLDIDLDSSGGGCDVGGSGGGGGSSIGYSGATMQHQQSLDGGGSGSVSSTLMAARAAAELPIETIEIVAEPLERIFDNKLVREKRLEMEKKLESMRKKHDKEKLRVTGQRSGGDLTEGIRKSKFYMNNKLVKRLSSKNMYAYSFVFLVTVKIYL